MTCRAVPAVRTPLATELHVNSLPACEHGGRYESLGAFPDHYCGAAERIPFGFHLASRDLVLRALADARGSAKAAAANADAYADANSETSGASTAAAARANAGATSARLRALYSSAMVHSDAALNSARLASGDLVRTRAVADVVAGLKAAARAAGYDP